tara:strand:- start:88285 stop:89775 length:1491 start_codon:yes stop_codon:yes gene_type:complete
MVPGLSCNSAKEGRDEIDLTSLLELEQIAEVQVRYQSVNVEMCEVVGGDFWVPYHLIDTAKVRAEGFSALKRSIPSIDLYDEKLRTLTKGLGPMYVRVSGTWANTTYFQNNDQPKLTQPPVGYENVLTRKEWKGVIDFCKATGSKLITSFAISAGMRDEEGNWTPAQVKPLLEYTHSIGGEIYAAEMFNEPSHASHGGVPEGYDAAQYAKDFVAFKSFLQTAAPNMKIMGPGSTGEGGLMPGIDTTMTTDKILTAEPRPEFDIFTYHFYGGVSQRCHGQLKPENAFNEDWLAKTEVGLKYYKEARNNYMPDAPLWLTETAEAACGGNPWAATYTDSFRYAEQLGRLAKNGVEVVMHNTLSASEYALLEQDTHRPRPNYWTALLWNQFMGTKVYQAKSPVEGLDVFVHNLKSETKGYALLIVNPSDIPSPFEIPAPSEQYLLTADDLLAKEVKLNGKVLQLNSDNSLPDIKGEVLTPGPIQVPPKSIMFLTIKDPNG